MLSVFVIFWLPLCFVVRGDGKDIPVHAIKSYRGAEIELHAFLTSALVGGEWATSRSSRLTLGKQPVPID